MLDVSKTFDRVNYCTLFNELLRRGASPLLLHTHHTLRVRWEHTLSNVFNVSNGVKQGGVLSPLYLQFTRILKWLQESGMGCHMGYRLSGAFAYADDLNLLSSSRSGLAVLIYECEKFAAEYDIMFNW